jgi:L-lysine exporter family protein LysE/ArgO
LPGLGGVARWAGAAFLGGYAVLAARRALRGTDWGLVVEPPRSGSPVSARTTGDAGTAASGTATAIATATGARTAIRSRSSLLPVVLTCLALTWLNPHVYLDTVVLLGSVGATHGDARWTFALGAVIASVAWFFGLAYGARLLGGVLASPRAWRVLDGIIAVVMLAIAVSLVLPA